MKTTCELSPAEVKLILKKWMKSVNIPVLDSDTFDIGPDASITISFEAPIPGEEPPVTPIKPVPPITPVAPVSPVQGHMITANPPMSATGQMTQFGYQDPGDNGIGFFTDPSTGTGFNTNNATIMGASIPREMLLSTFHISDDWRIPSLSDENTSVVWSHHAGAVRQYALDHKVTVNIDSGGLSARSITLMDAGPEAIGPHGVCIGNVLDCTFALANELNTQGKALGTIEVLVDGVTVPILGWNATSACVG
jgi:hypothetical protein